MKEVFSSFWILVVMGKEKEKRKNKKNENGWGGFFGPIMVRLSAFRHTGLPLRQALIR